MDIEHTNNAADTLQSEFKHQTVLFIKTDISKKDQVKDAFDEIVIKFISIDIVLCNAGILNDRDYELSVNVNLVKKIFKLLTDIENDSLITVRYTAYNIHRNGCNEQNKWQ